MPALFKGISEKKDISLKYLGQLIILLKITELIKSTNISRGEYFMSRALEDMKLYETLERLP